MSDNFPLTFLLQVKNEMGSGISKALDLKIAHTELRTAIDKYGKGSIQAAKAQSALNKLENKGGVDTEKVTKALMIANLIGENA
jgi:hypothetical protein